MRRPRLLIALLACAGLLAGAWLLLRSRAAVADPGAVATTVRPYEDGTATGTEESGHVEPHAAAQGALPRSSESRRSLPDGPSGPERTVLVTRAYTGEPVPDAVVHVLAVPEDEHPAEFVERERAQDDDLDAFFARYTRTFRADSRGLATVRAASGDVLYGLAPGLAGRTEVDDGPERTTHLALQPDAAVRVRVVDPEGNPVAGAPVELRLVPHYDPEERWTLRRRLTGRDGSALLDHLPLFFELGRPDDADRPVLGLAIPSAARIEAELPPGVVPAPGAGTRVPGGTPPTVTLRMPATGSLVVHLVDADGQPVRAVGSTYLLALDPEDARVAALPEPVEPGTGPREPLNGLDYGEGVHVYLVDGVARYPFVPLGRTLGLVALCPRVTSESPELVLEELHEPGEAREVSLTVEGSDVEIVLHLVLPNGAPLTERGVAVEARRSYDARFRSLRTDPAGALRLREPGSLASRPPQALVFRVGAAGTSVDEPAYEAMVTAIPELVPGTNDLGTVRLRPSPLLAAGHVVDGEGAPIAGLRVRVGWIQERHGSDPPWFRSPIGAAPLCMTDASGAFVFHGGYRTAATRAERYGLQVDGDLIVALPPIAFEPGQEDLVVEATVAGWLDGTVRAVSPLALDGVVVHAYRSDDESFHGVDFDPRSASFHAEGLAPGDWDLTFFTRDDDAIVEDIQRVHVPLGERAADPRLEGVDLTGILVTRLGVRSAEGLLPDTTTLALRRAADDEWTDLEDLAGRRRRELVTTLVTTARGFDLRLLAEGFRRTTIEGVEGDVDAVLRPGLPVVLELEGDPLAPLVALAAEAGAIERLTLRFEWECTDDPDLHAQALAGPGEREALARLPEEGTYSLSVFLDAHSDGRIPDESEPLGDLVLGPVDVQAGATPQRLPLHPDPARLRAAYESIVIHW